MFLWFCGFYVFTDSIVYRQLFSILFRAALISSCFYHGVRGFVYRVDSSIAILCLWVHSYNLNLYYSLHVVNTISKSSPYFGHCDSLLIRRCPTLRDGLCTLHSALMPEYSVVIDVIFAVVAEYSLVRYGVCFSPPDFWLTIIDIWLSQYQS